MGKEEVLAKASALYELLWSGVYEFAPSDSPRYVELRTALLSAVGRPALPSVIRDCPILGDCVNSIPGGGFYEKRGSLKASFQPFFESLESDMQTTEPASTPLVAAPRSSIDIFISHSKNDQALAEALQELLVFALQIPAESIRISSVAGSRLKGGELFEDRLRKDISGCRVFIALVTPSLLRSYYSLFELGGRWELDILGDSFACEWKVLVARGAEKGKLPDPLKQRNALDLAQRDDAEQFLLDMQDVLQRKAGPANKYLTQVVEEASRIPPGFGGAGLSNKERVILRTLFDEEDGRYLSRYRDDDKYQKKIAALIDRELIRETGGKLKLTEKGAEVVREYLLSHLL